jgi:hypothetical protein
MTEPVELTEQEAFNLIMDKLKDVFDWCLPPGALKVRMPETDQEAINFIHQKMDEVIKEFTRLKSQNSALVNKLNAKAKSRSKKKRGY